ncbi:uncharacterized protein Fot_06354 [Forsythia ovata]|uniref:Uncharacterized protein n=1 Tax=Forsythia ovata TaxID=205694 RepID=A0ABD1WSQ4_9LAMI
MGLMQVTLENGVSLRVYISCFNKAILGIKDLLMSSVITALLNYLKNCTIKANLSKSPPKSMIKLLRMGEKYIDQEEVLKATYNANKEDEGSNRKRSMKKCGKQTVDELSIHLP